MAIWGDRICVHDCSSAEAGSLTSVQIQLGTRQPLYESENQAIINIKGWVENGFFTGYDLLEFGGCVFSWQVQYNMVIGRTKVITSGSKDDFQGTIGRFSLHLVAQTTRGLTSVNEGPMVSPGPQLNRYICFSSCCIENYIDLVHSTWDPISEAKQKQRESNVNPIISHVWIRAEAIGTLWPSPNVSTESRVMALTKKTISMTILITIPTATVCQIRIQFPYEILSFFDSPSTSDDFGWLAKDIQPDWHWCWDGRLEADFSQSTTADAQAIKE